MYGVTPASGSAGGGTRLTVHGGGFPRDVVSVRVCGATCGGVNVSSDGASITCVTSPLATVANAAALGVGAVPPEVEPCSSNLVKARVERDY